MERLRRQLQLDDEACFIIRLPSTARCASGRCLRWWCHDDCGDDDRGWLGGGVRQKTKCSGLLFEAGPLKPVLGRFRFGGCDASMGVLDIVYQPW